MSEPAVGVESIFLAALEIVEPAERARRHLRQAGLPTTLGETGVDRAALLPLMGADKKNEGGQLRLVLTRGIGDAFLARDVEAARLADFLARAA